MSSEDDYLFASWMEELFCETVEDIEILHGVWDDAKPCPRCEAMMPKDNEFLPSTDGHIRIAPLTWTCRQCDYTMKAVS